MQTRELVVATPYYVLMDQKAPFGTKVADPALDIDFSAIFGFSDKAPYDSFCGESSVLLTPYPLVKGYLRNQLSRSDHDSANQLRVQLVILDALGPSEPYVHAATMQAVLDAQEKHTPHMTPTHHLTFDPKTNVYRISDTTEHPSP